MQPGRVSIKESLSFEVYHSSDQPDIHPATWRAGVWGGRWTNEQAKKHAVEMATAVHGVRVPQSHHHTAEAMWIAAYAQTMLKQAALKGES